MNYKLKVPRGGTEPASQLWAVGGGKGGVGKSFVSSAIAIFLANMGYKTLLVDLDIGASNLHTYVGEGISLKNGLDQFLNNPDSDISTLISPTKIPNLHLICGDSDSIGVANIDSAQKSRLMSAIFNTEADHVILDLSAGTHDTTLDFFLMAQKQIITMTPDPSSIENAYRFMKSAFFRKLKRFEDQLNLDSVIASLMENPKETNIRTPADLMTQINKIDPARGAELSALMGGFEPNIILNQTRTYNDAALGNSVKSVCSKYFGLPAQYLGHVDYDNAVWQSLRKRRHLLIEHPQSHLYTQLMKITRNLVYSGQSKTKSAS